MFDVSKGYIFQPSTLLGSGDLSGLEPHDDGHENLAMIKFDSANWFHLNATSTHVCSFVPFQPSLILGNPSNAAERRPQRFAISKACGLRR